MSLKFHDSPFHVTHDEKIANKMAMKMDLSMMISALIKEKRWTQSQAAEILDVNQSRISDLKNAKLEKFTIDALIDMLELLSFKVTFTMTSFEQALISIEKDKVED